PRYQPLRGIVPVMLLVRLRGAMRILLIDDERREVVQELLPEHRAAELRRNHRVEELAMVVGIIHQHIDRRIPHHRNAVELRVGMSHPAMQLCASGFLSYCWHLSSLPLTRVISYAHDCLVAVVRERGNTVTHCLASKHFNTPDIGSEHRPCGYVMMPLNTVSIADALNTNMNFRYICVAM